MSEDEEPKQIAMMKQVVALAEKQTQLSAARSEMSAARSEMSETRSYHNAERTLSVWVRTALSTIIVGLAIDRFGLLLDRIPGSGGELPSARGALLDTISTWTCIALVVLGIVMALTTGLRFFAYAREWSSRHELPAHHGPYLASFFAVLVALFGILVLAIMVAAAW